MVGTTYRVAKSALGVTVLYTHTVDGVSAFSGNGWFGASLDQFGTELLVGMADLTKARIFSDPSADLNLLQDPAAIAAATTPVPDDFLAYFSTLPFVTVGPIEEVEFLGLPGRSMTFETGPVEQGFPCFGVDRGNCLLTLYLPTELVQNYWEGDSGTLYELVIDDRKVLVEVTDREGAAETAAGIAIGD